jgi:hypothetical protein
MGLVKALVRTKMMMRLLASGLEFPVGLAQKGVEGSLQLLK